MSRLEGLPLELQFNVLRHVPQPRDRTHPYLVLSLVSRQLLAVVDSYCQSRLMVLHNRHPATGPKPPFTTQKVPARRRLLQHLWSRCSVCDRKSRRRAIMVPELTCCKECDRKQWPGKITMTDAVKKYRLRKDQLFSARLATGRYLTMNTWTTMFLEPEVRELAAKIHSRNISASLDEFLEAKNRQLEEAQQRRTAKLKMERRELRALLTANGFDADVTFPHLSRQLRPDGNRRSSSPHTIVRNHILEHRLRHETDYTKRRDVRLPEEGYAWLSHSDDFLTRTGAVSETDWEYDGLLFKQIPMRDPRDEALAQLFIKDFGPLSTPTPGPTPAPAQAAAQIPESKIKTPAAAAKRPVDLTEIPGLPTHQYLHWSYPRLRAILESTVRYDHHGFSDARLPLWDDFASFFSRPASPPPWSWLHYPVLVKQAFVRNPDSRTPVNEAAETEKINQWNRERGAEFDRVCEWIRHVVRRGGLRGETPDDVASARRLWARDKEYNPRWSREYFLTGGEQAGGSP